MSVFKFDDIPVWKKLKEHAEFMKKPENCLASLLEDKNRFNDFSIKGGGLFFDYSRQRVDKKTMELLYELAQDRNVAKTFQDMVKGEVVNVTEKRAALHTATRSFADDRIDAGGVDVMKEVNRVRDEIKVFVEKIFSGEIKGSTGKAFKHAVVIGIGGSYLGPEFVSSALAAFGNTGIALHYLANVDIQDFGRVAAEIDPETTIWVVISKSYTTPETTSNTVQAYDFMKSKGLDPAKHVVTVTSQGSPGDDPANPVIATFHMFDFIGGRYSVTSAVGGVPLSLYIGYDRFESFLKGAETMDIHANEAAPEKNAPLTAALLGIWNNNFLGYNCQGIIPYASPLSKLAPHVQQLYMESNGKYVTTKGQFLDEETGMIMFGEPGTNAQHSFFQLAHQGQPFPIDFIGVINPQYTQYNSKSKGVTNFQELWANLISQPAALAAGMDNEDKARFFPGNRPSTTIILNDLEPASVGTILAFYEARTVMEAFVWDINPFDQFGVQLGKTMAADVRVRMEAKNENPDTTFDDADPIVKAYLEMLFNGSID